MKNKLTTSLFVLAVFLTVSATINDKITTIQSSSEMELKVGDKAPDFELVNQSGKTTRLYDITGSKNIVLFFYPKDNTPICTKEACAFRDNYEIFQENGAEVIGISTDDNKSHKNFTAYHNLPYLLLSDEGGKVRKRYGVPKTMGFLPGRVTYVIDKKSTIRHIFNSQLNYNKHIEEAIKVLKSLDKNE